MFFEKLKLGSHFCSVVSFRGILSFFYAFSLSSTIRRFDGLFPSTVGSVDGDSKSRRFFDRLKATICRLYKPVRATVSLYICCILRLLMPRGWYCV